MATRETNNNQDIRWKQRFAHFKKAFRLLEQTMAIEHPSEAKRAELIQFFEMSFKLAWKVLLRKLFDCWMCGNTSQAMALSHNPYREGLAAGGVWG